MSNPRVTRDAFERRNQTRVQDQITYNNYVSKINAETMDKVHQETDSRAVMRHKIARQRIADQEYQMAEKLYRQQHEMQERQHQQEEQDAIARALAEQTQSEVRDQKMRGLLRENDPEYRELQSKLQLAKISQTRDNQRNELKMRRELEEQERLETEEQMMRKYRREEEARAAEEAAKHAESLATRHFIQEQLRDKERRRQLLEVAQHEKDKQQIDEIVQRIAEEDRLNYTRYRQKQANEREEMVTFMAARERMKAEERLIEEEEDKKMKAFAANVDERLARAQAEQKMRDEQRQGIAERIANDIRRQRQELEEYENLCLELAEQQELQRLKEREEAEARKIQQQIEECKRFMVETHKAKARQAEITRAEELRLRQQIVEQQKKVAELAEIEQEQNRIRIEKFRRELSRQMVQKKQMYEQARQQELRKLQIEAEREQERQRILNEERRKLVIDHILSMGPEAVKYLPKGVLKEDDLNYLPEDYRSAILRQQQQNQ